MNVYINAEAFVHCSKQDMRKFKPAERLCALRTPIVNGDC